MSRPYERWSLSLLVPHVRQPAPERLEGCDAENNETNDRVVVHELNATFSISFSGCQALRQTYLVRSNSHPDSHAYGSSEDTVRHSLPDSMGVERPATRKRPQ